MKKHKLSQDHRTGIYFVRIQQNGFSQRFSFGKSQSEALQQLRDLERDIERGLIKVGPSERDMMLSELINLHLEWVEANRSKGTYKLRCHYLELFQKWAGNVPVSSFTRRDMDRFWVWAKRFNGHSINAGLEAAAHVKVLFRWALQESVCIHNIRSFPKIKRETADTRRFSQDELKKLFPVLSEDFRDVLLFGLLTGLRPQELRALHKRDFLVHHGQTYLNIEHHKTSKHSKYSRPRSIPLCSAAEEIYQRALERFPDEALLFLSAKGTPYTKDTFRQRLIRGCDRAGIPRKPPYALRHTFGTTQALTKTNQTIIAQLMGHRSINTTTRYIANLTEAHQNAVSDMEKSFEGLL